MSGKELFLKAWENNKGDLDVDNARVGGRATKANPNKEDANFWLETGPKWVDDYITWRKNNPNWKIWTTPQGVPAIELELNPVIDGITIRMFIDRIFIVDDKHLVVTDLKTSKDEPASALQLGFYRFGIEQTFGVKVDWGNYFMARKAGVGQFIDLTTYTEDKIRYLITNFEKARQQGIFLPNTNACNYTCGFNEFCPYNIKK